MTKKTFVMTKGLPGSGKSTWATAEVLQWPAGGAVRVNQDSLRIMLHADRFEGRRTEDITRDTKNLLVDAYMKRVIPIIISDDTNFSKSAEDKFRELALNNGYEFKIKDFTHVPVETCIKNDLKRLASVGEQVIRKMHKKYLAPPQVQVPAPAWIDGLPTALIVDIDGTVALMNGRSPYDPSQYHTDLRNDPVAEIVFDYFQRGDHIVFCSGRDDTYRDATIKWIQDHMDLDPKTVEEEANWPVRLLMRPAARDAEAGKKRNDAIVKREIYDEQIAGKYNVRFVLDDRDRVVEMWRSVGLPCLQVAPGDF
jgi:predicted kinase